MPPPDHTPSPDTPPVIDDHDHVVFVIDEIEHSLDIFHAVLDVARQIRIDAVGIQPQP
jgi:hypothetical protein